MGTSAVEVVFRKMTPDDADTVAEIERRCFVMPWKRDDFWRYAQEQHILCIVGELRIKDFGLEDLLATYPKILAPIICYALVFVSGDESDVINIAVDPEYQGRGIGTKLFAEVIRIIKLRGVCRITLEVRPSNTPARKLYEKFGLRVIGRRKKYYTDNDEDALVMWNTHLREMD